MSALHALILGILQGITEFFPVSSSAHLKIAKMFLGVEGGEGQVVFDLVCHLGTLTALLYFLRKEILNVTREQLKGFFLALLPLVPAYFLLKPVREWASQIHLLGFFLILTSFILFCGHAFQLPAKKRKDSSVMLLIGAMQSLALIPGISRSASTIACARFLGWSAGKAVRFSFLLAIPTIIGGNCLELLKIALSSHAIPEISISGCILGFLASCSMGLVAIGFGFRFLERGCFKPFAWYCLIVGTSLSIYTATYG